MKRTSAFIIPKDADFLKVYKTAKEKGLRIKSRYKGVYLIDYLKPMWRAQSKLDNKSIYFGYFPFTAQGEIDAAKAYRDYNKSVKT